jgi:hypothetical protein
MRTRASVSAAGGRSTRRGFLHSPGAKKSRARLEPRVGGGQHRPKPKPGGPMLHRLAAYIHFHFLRRARGVIAALEGDRGQGTVEYVGLILLVSLLMVGMVAAMKGFNGKQGTELADLIVNKIKQAVNGITFR